VKLAAVKTDDGEITEAVTKITWTATAGGLKPGEFDLFTVSAGPLPTNTKLLRSRPSDLRSGEVVRWIRRRQGRRSGRTDAHPQGPSSGHH
jgi:hypothetical protein